MIQCLPYKGAYKLTQEYGVNPQNYTQFLVLFPDGVRRSMDGHNGLDFGTPDGTECVAPHDGEILETVLDLKGYGWYVKIESEEEGSVLAHLQRIDVKVGYKLKAGDHIGTTDNTGYSTNSHHHWGYYRKPRDRANGRAGFIDQTPFLVALGYTVKLGELVVKNNISQPEPTTQLYTKDQYDSCMADREKFWRERDNALKDLGEKQKQLDEANSILSGFRAMGYNTIDDVTKALNKKDEDVVGIKQQLVTALQRNTTLANELSKKDHEDSTAIEDGLNAMTELKQLKDDIAQMTKATGANKPTVTDIVSRIDFLKGMAEKWMRAKEHEHKVQQEKKALKQVNETPNQSTFAKTLLALFGLEGR